MKKKQLKRIIRAQSSHLRSLEMRMRVSEQAIIEIDAKVDGIMKHFDLVEVTNVALFDQYAKQTDIETLPEGEDMDCPGYDISHMHVWEVTKARDDGDEVLMSSTLFNVMTPKDSPTVGTGMTLTEKCLHFAGVKITVARYEFTDEGQMMPVADLIHELSGTEPEPPVPYDDEQSDVPSPSPT